MARIDFEKTEQELAQDAAPKYLRRGVYIWPCVAVTSRTTDKGQFILSIVFDTGYQKEGQPLFENADFFMLDKNVAYKEINVQQLNKLRDTLMKVFGVPFSKVSSIVDTEEVNKLAGLVANLHSAVRCEPQYKLVGKEACVTYDWPNKTTHPEGKFFQEIQFLNNVSSYEWASGKFDHDRPNPNPQPAAQANQQTAHAQPAAASTAATSATAAAAAAQTAAPNTSAAAAARPAMPASPGGLVMTDKAEFTLEQYRGAGWTDEQLITQGLATRYTAPAAAPAAPAAPAKPAAPTAAEMAAARQPSLDGPANIGSENEPDDLPF